MKKILFILFVLAFSGSTHAQKDSSFFEVGANTIRVLQFGMGSSKVNYDVWNPYMLTLEGHYKRLGLRVGLGYDSKSNSELPTDANGMTRFENDTMRSDLRIGLLWDINLHEKWTVKIGIDQFTVKTEQRAFTDFTNAENVKVSTEHTVTRTERGFAPFVYFQYHINPRISLGTELMWRFSKYEINDLDTNSLSENVIEFNHEGTRRFIMAPTALFLCARF